MFIRRLLIVYAVLSALRADGLRAQPAREGDTLPDAARTELDETALQELRESFLNLSGVAPLPFGPGLFPPEIPGKGGRMLCPRFLLQENRLETPVLGQLRKGGIGGILFIPLSKGVRVYVKGRFDAQGAGSPTACPARDRPMYVGAGLSFRLKERETLDVGVKYALDPAHDGRTRKWNSLMDCTLHF